MENNRQTEFEDMETVYNNIKQALADGNYEEVADCILVLISKAETLDVVFDFSIDFIKRLLEIDDIEIIEKVIVKTVDRLIEDNKVQSLFEYFIKLGTLNSKAVNALIMQLESRVSCAADKNNTISSNIKWLRKCNRPALKEINPKINEFEIPDQFLLDFVCRHNTDIYYSKNGSWNKEAISFTKVDSGTQALHYACDISRLYSVMIAYLNDDDVTNIRKYNKYIVVDKPVFFFALQIIDFSEFDKCNGVFHFVFTNNYKQMLIEKINHGVPYANMCDAETNNRIEGLSDFFYLLNKQYVDQVNLKAQVIQDLYSEYDYDSIRDSYCKNVKITKKIRVMFISTRYSTFVGKSAKSLAKGFLRLGCRVLILSEKKNHGYGHLSTSIENAIIRFKPDLIIAINSFRDTLFASSTLTAATQNIPFATWLHDTPVTLIAVSSNIFPMDFLFTHSENYKELLISTNKNFSNVQMHLLNAFLSGNRVIQNKSVQKEYDLGYIAHLNISREIKRWYQSKAPESDYEMLIHEALPLMMNMDEDRLLSICSTEISNDPFVDEFLIFINNKISTPFDKKFVLQAVRFKVAHFLLKLKPVIYLIESGYTSLVLGGNGWDFIEKCRPFAIGSVDTLEDMNQLISKTRINLSLSPETSIHSRVSEVGGNGSFVLVFRKKKSWLTSITDYFIEDEEVVLFNDCKDMKEKIDYYLEHENEREVIAEALQKKILAQYTVEAGAKKILAVVYGSSKEYLV